MKTIIHERVDSANSGKNLTAIIKLRSGWLVLGDNQTIPGYCILLSDPVEDTINSIHDNKRKQFLDDMVFVGDILMEVVKPININYSILGNTDKALHAHIHPRYDWEKEENRKMPPFYYNFKNEANIQFDYNRDKDLIQKIRDAIINKKVNNT